MKSKNLQRGFTLIEILFYFAVLSVVLTAIMSFSLQILNLSQKSENFHELQNSSTLITDKISTAIKEADSVDVGNSIFNANPGKLSLNMSNPAESPTAIYKSGDNILYKIGANEAIQLNSNGTKCNNLTFQRLTYPKTSDQIVIDIECHPLNEELSSQNQTFNIHTSVSLRK